MDQPAAGRKIRATAIDELLTKFMTTGGAKSLTRSVPVSFWAIGGAGWMGIVIIAATAEIHLVMA